MIVAGFGFRSCATPSSLRSALDLARESAPEVTHLATLADKVEGLDELARSSGLPVIAVLPHEAEALPLRTTSPASLHARGLGSVAEACALAAFLPGEARLVAPRSISTDRMATCAIAQGVSA